MHTGVLQCDHIHRYVLGQPAALQHHRPRGAQPPAADVRAVQQRNVDGAFAHMHLMSCTSAHGMREVVCAPRTGRTACRRSNETFVGGAPGGQARHVASQVSLSTALMRCPATTAADMRGREAVFSLQCHLMCPSGGACAEALMSSDFRGGRQEEPDGWRAAVTTTSFDAAHSFIITSSLM